MWDWLTNMFSSTGSATQASGSGLSAAGNATSGASAAGGATGGAGGGGGGGLAQPAQYGTGLNATGGAGGGGGAGDAMMPMSPAGGSGDSLSGMMKLESGTGYSPVAGPAPTETANATQPNVSETPQDELSNAVTDYLIGTKAEGLTHAPDEGGLGGMGIQPPQQQGVAFKPPDSTTQPTQTPTSPANTPDPLTDRVGRVWESGQLSDVFTPGGTPHNVASTIEGYYDKLKNAPQPQGSPEQPVGPYQAPPEIPQFGMVRTQGPAAGDVQRRYAQLMASLRR